MSQEAKDRIGDGARARAEKRWTPERRQKLIELRQAGWGYKAIAEELNICRSSACKLYKKYSGDMTKHAQNYWPQEKIDTLFRLKDVEGLSYAKIAKIMGMSEGSLMYRYKKHGPQEE